MTRERLNAADLDAIQKRANDATPLPWRVYGDTIWTHSEEPPTDEDDEVAQFDWLESAQRLTWGDFEHAADLAFAFHARTDIPSLVAEVRACWEERERLAAALRVLVPVAQLYVDAFADDELMSLAEKMRFQEVEAALLTAALCVNPRRTGAQLAARRHVTAKASTYPKVIALNGSARLCVNPRRDAR